MGPTRLATNPAPRTNEVRVGASSRPRKRLGDVVIDLGFASREEVEEVVEQAREDGRLIGQALVEGCVINSNQLAQAIAARNGLDYVDLSAFEVDPVATNLIGAEEAHRYRAIPVAFVDEETILVATSDPSNLLAMDNIALSTELKVLPVVAAPGDIEALLDQITRLADSVQEVEIEAEEEARYEPEVTDLREGANDAPIVKLVHSILADAVGRGTSDIHLEPSDGDLRVRYRVDGVVVDAATVPKRMAPGLISRIKIMAELDIAERRAPQDGRIRVTVEGRVIDIRVSILPVLRGESAVLRILDKGRLAMRLDHLGMRAHDRDLLRWAVARTHGAVIVTGPTGSGKTTTLYATLAEINTPDRTVIAIEDPAEYELEGIKQIQVNPKVGLTFPSGLRSMVRSDPDVLMVGEIRDRETAQIAIEAALTGHMVLSTLHTGNAPMAPARLVEMGVEPFLVASSITCVVAQRLARRLCDECKHQVLMSPEQLRPQGIVATEAVHVYESVGCMRCKGTGFRGRIGIYEMLRISPEIGDLILRRASADEIAARAAEEGNRRMREDAIEKVRQGLTSLPEMLRVLGS